MTPKRKIEEDVVEEEVIERPRKVRRIVYDEPSYQDDRVIESLHDQVEKLKKRSDETNFILDEILYGSNPEEAKSSSTNNILDTVKSSLGQLLGTFTVPAILFIIDLYSKKASQAKEVSNTSHVAPTGSDGVSNANYAALFK